MDTSGVVVVLGASPKADRFAYQAFQLLKQKGWTVVPVHPTFSNILGAPCYARIQDVPEKIHTLTLYVGAARSTPMIADIIGCRPRRIIFNPGAENPELAREALKNDIEVVQDCTLIMLNSGRF